MASWDKIPWLRYAEFFGAGRAATGTVLHDLSKNHYNGDFESSGHPAWTQLTSGLYCLDFDGTQDYVDVGDQANLSFGDGTTDEAFSCAVWVYLVDATDSCVMSKYDANAGPVQQEYDLRFDANDKLYLHVWDSSLQKYVGRIYDTAFTGSENEWHLVVATYDGSEASSGVKLYIDETQVDDADSEDPSGYDAMENTTANFLLGALVTAGPAYTILFDGNMALPFVVNEELSLQDVRTWYNSTRHWFGV